VSEKSQTYLEIHVDRWNKKKKEGGAIGDQTGHPLGKTTTWNNDLDAGGQPLYDHNGRLNKYKRSGPFQAKIDWDPLK